MYNHSHGVYLVSLLLLIQTLYQLRARPSLFTEKAPNLPYPYLMGRRLWLGSFRGMIGSTLRAFFNFPVKTEEPLISPRSKRQQSVLSSAEIGESLNRHHRSS